MGIGGHFCGPSLARPYLVPRPPPPLGPRPRPTVGATPPPLHTISEACASLDLLQSGIMVAPNARDAILCPILLAVP